MLNLAENLQKILFLKKVVLATRKQFKKKTHSHIMAPCCLILLLSKWKRCEQPIFLWMMTNLLVTSWTFRWISLLLSFLSRRIKTLIRTRLQQRQAFWHPMNPTSTHLNPKSPGEFKVLRRRRTSQFRLAKFRPETKWANQTRPIYQKLSVFLLCMKSQLKSWKCKKFQINLGQQQTSNKSWMGSTSRWLLKRKHTPTSARTYKHWKMRINLAPTMTSWLSPRTRSICRIQRSQAQYQTD